MQGGPDLDLAAEKLLDDPATMTEDELKAIRSLIMIYLRGRLSRAVDVEDLTQDTLMRLIQRQLKSNRIEAREVRNPIGYVLGVAQRTAVDHWRATHVEGGAIDLNEDIELIPASDDEIARLLDRQAGAQQVRDALKLAVAHRDETVVRVVAFILDHLQEHGQPPSNRSVGSALGLSHTGVAKALDRYRSLLAQAAREGIG